MGVHVEGKPITINPSVPFYCLTMLIKQEEKRMEMIKYELVLEPAALFKDGCMHSGSKSILRSKILDVHFMVPKPKVDFYVVGGCLLLHKTVWPLPSRQRT